MPNINKANRQVCDVLFMDAKTKKPFLSFETANTTTAGITGDAVYAMAKGARRISFPNAPEGTLTIESQVHPFEYYSLFSDGTIDSSAMYGEKQTVKCTTAGTVTISVPTGVTVQTGTVFVYPADSFGVGDAIAGAYTSGTFTATAAADIAVDSFYTVGYVVSRTSKVKKISFNAKKMPKDFYITMSTLDKDEFGVYTPFKLVFYKATPKRSFELSFKSEGDPMSLSCQLDLLEDRNGDFVDMLEIIEYEAMDVSKAAVSLVVGGTTPNISITGAVGTVTAEVKDNSNAAYTKLHAVVSGDNDTVIIYADSDAAAGAYKVILTDSTSGTAQTVTIAVTITAAT